MDQETKIVIDKQGDIVWNAYCLNCKKQISLGDGMKVEEHAKKHTGTTGHDVRVGFIIRAKQKK